MIVQKVPSWLIDSTGQTESTVLGHPVWQGIGKLGEVLETLSRELMTASVNMQEHTVEFRDRNKQKHRLRIRAIRLEISDQSTSEILTLLPHPPPEKALFFRLSEEILPDEQSISNYRSSVFHGIVGGSTAIRHLVHRIEQYGPADASVIIQGETGTGKELVARALHEVSKRSRYSFVAINCTALNEELFESELFGHERGSFTGAIKMHKGRFERAENGTLFLDEIGDMPGRTQAKLLRVLENRIIERVGGESEIPVNVRIICATNIPLERAMANGQFRPDLFHRLAILRIHVPALRDRTGDIPILVEFFLDMLNRRYQKDIHKITPEAIRLLEAYHWPGNVRELRNVIERIYVETQGTVISRNNFRDWENERDFLMAGQWDIPHYETQHLVRTPFQSQSGLVSRRTKEDSVPSHSPFMDHTLLPALPISGFEMKTEPRVAHSSSRGVPVDVTESLVRKAFHASRGNITAASHALGIHKATLYRLLKRWGITRADLSTDMTHQK